jgi:hypothetical protein
MVERQQRRDLMNRVKRVGNRLKLEKVLHDLMNELAFVEVDHLLARHSDCVRNAFFNECQLAKMNATETTNENKGTKGRCKNYGKVGEKSVYKNLQERNTRWFASSQGFLITPKPVLWTSESEFGK